ncbi:hypothetical protein [Candidatus Methanoprimaticola sp. MG2]|uniref:hypothetical protein n=1 Tax=Candidatus Methanoprimaticola sp. MG2 TaxID=3228838 RepID=UPI0039C61B0C
MLWGGGLSRSKLLAAVAVLAIAFAVFAAVPAVAEDSDANTGVESSTSSSGAITTVEALTNALTTTGSTSINLGADLTLTCSNTLTIFSEGKTIDLNGKTLTITGENLPKLITFSENLEFKDGTLVVTLTGAPTDDIASFLSMAAFYTETTEKTLKFTNLTLKMTVSVDNEKSFGIYGGANKAFTNVDGFITAGNRAIQMDGSNTLIFTDCGSAEAPFVLSGHEKAIQAKTCTGGVTLIKSYIDLELLETGGLNGGSDDAFALKASKLTVDKDSVLKADGVHIVGSGSEISGKLYVEYNSLNMRAADGENKIAIPGGLILYGEDGNGNPGSATTLTVKDAGELYVEAGCSIAGTITGTKTASKDGTMTFGNVTTESEKTVFTYATVDSDAKFVAGSLDLTQGKVIVDDLTVSTNTVIGADVTVKGKLTLEGNITVDGALKVEGTYEGQSKEINVGPTGKLTIGCDMSGAIVNNEGIVYLTDKDVTLPAITGPGTFDASQVAKDGTISGEWKTETPYGAYQTITLSGDTTLADGTVIIIQGKLIIPEGMTLTIEDGAKLVIYNGTASLENDGTVVVQSDKEAIATVYGGMANYIGGLAASNGAKVINNGVISLDYTLLTNQTTDSMNATMTVNGANLINDGQIIVGETSRFVPNETSVVKNNADATFELNGQSALKGTFENAGLVIINGNIRVNTTIHQVADGAKVEIVSLESWNNNGTVYDLIISDLKIVDTAKKQYTNDNTNTVVLSPVADWSIEGLTITTQIVKNTKITTTTEYYKQFDIAGSVVSSYLKEGDVPNSHTDVDVGFTGRNIIAGEFSVGKDVAIKTANSGDFGMIVSGDVSVVEEGAFTFAASGNNDLTVSGKITLVGSDITGSGTVNAAKYDIPATTGVKKQNIYTTLETALADGAKKITMKGENTIKTESVTIPADVTVKNEGLLTIAKESKVDFKTGSKLQNTNSEGEGIVVNGVLYIEDVKGTKNPATITSDVTIAGEKDITYCGLAYALNNAEENEVVELSNNTCIKESMKIPAGVTLDTKGYELCIHKGVTLTVDGTLYINESTIKVNTHIVGTDDLKDNMKVVLNGMIKSKESSIPAALGLAGAFYSIVEKGTTYNIAEPVANAAAKIADAEDQTMNLRGELAIGDVTFASTTDKPAKIYVENNLSAGTITLDNAQIIFAAGKTFVGTIANGVGSVDISGLAGTDMKIASVTADDVVSLKVTGGFDKYTDAKKTTVFTAVGKVTLGKADIAMMTVDGELSVADVESKIADLVINGTVTVQNEKTLTSDNIEVFGSLVAVAKTDSKGQGNIVVNNLYIGVAKKVIDEGKTGAAASVSGEMTVKNMAVVSDGSTIPADVVKGIPSTEFYVEDEKFVTVYDFNESAANKVDINDIKYVVPNADPNGWVKADGTSIKDGEKIGSVDKVDAKIEYDVYVVRVLANVGVNDVSIDGNLMMYNPLLGFYQATVSAGKHTITYTLANGFSGEAKMAINGAVYEGATCTLNGMDFNISGKFTEYDTDTAFESNPVVTLQLTGIEKSGYVPDAPDSGDNGGMTITDYLLIILVVLIVVMAIIVAMRLMRS